MAVSNLENDNADLVVATAMTEVYLSMFLASSPNERKAAPANAAACGKSAPVACANVRTLFVALSISVWSNPSLASSVSKSTTCAAVYLVVAPNFLASASNACTLAGVVPRIADKVDIEASKSTIVATPDFNPTTDACIPITSCITPKIPADTSAKYLFIEDVALWVVAAVPCILTPICRSCFMQASISF
ncbi:hypothetical protein Barb4_03352 [Bacteroidales bacterium Barb4]|nr:hypothetical protein Barb4_03352 [Bacteroidales bacterium Barb4]